jgi:hypothetical protein
MPATSTYVQLSEYALMEYVYANETITTTTARPLRLYNGYTDQYQFLNSSAAVNVTGNVLDRSSSRMGLDSDMWAYQDIDSPTPTIQLDANFKLVDETSFLLTNQEYDTVKVYLAAGYDFPGLDGFIVEIQWEEWSSQGNGGRRFTAAAQTYLKGGESVNYATNPLFLGDRYYDRYVEFKVPALSFVNEDFWNSPSASNTIGYQYTFNNVGFLQASLIYANIYEIDQTETRNSNSFFRTGNKYSTSFTPNDQYSFIGATVRENTEYDFIEYFPTYNGGFLEDYLATLNASSGGDWIVINQINVYEQAGSSYIRTSSNTLLQEDNFNEPAIFRPIIRNAAFVFSFTVEYIMRLLNKVSNQEIIRKSTYTSSEPKKYGYSLQKVNVLEGFRPVRVYNKVVKVESGALASSIISSEGAYGFGTPKIVTQNVYVNNYIDVNYISVDSTTNVGDVIGQTVYPQGLNYIFINKFDNYVKFKIFTKSPDKKQNVTIDFASNGMNVKLAFIFDDDTKIYLDPTQDIQAANPGAGELLFRIDDSLSTKLIKGTNREYYIINKNEKGDEVLIYSGKFESQDKKIDILAKINETIISDLQSQLTKLQKAQENLTRTAASSTPTTVTAAPVATTVTTPTVTPAETPAAVAVESPSTALIAESEQQQAAIVDQATTFVTTASAGISDAIKKASIDFNNDDIRLVKLNVPDIPGVTPILGAPITLASIPKVIKPSKPTSKGTLAQRLTRGAIIDIANEQSI